jgi:hypothetical protein
LTNTAMRRELFELMASMNSMALFRSREFQKRKHEVNREHQQG